MQTLHVDLGQRSYPIHIGPGLLSRADLLLPHLSGRQVMVVTNETVAPLYLAPVRDALADRTVEVVVLPDGERFKTIATTQTIFDHLLNARFGRTATLVALGGGVVGDITGFAAACYQRGIDFVQIPTTLLAQVDSSVGGKTGVNHPQGKNMIGAFHQPRCVIADTNTLSTLPDRELAAGAAEAIKYGLIDDRAFFDWLEQNIDRLLARDPDALTWAIERACRNKAAVVARDEREQGARALLNLGHTFGHAIEATTGYDSWLHGEAVATGMLMAADLSERLGWLAPEATVRLRDLLQRARLPESPPDGMTAADFAAKMAIDKKVTDGRLKLILLRGIGQGVISDSFDRAALESTLSHFTGTNL